MSFLYPSLFALGGLLALAPIVVHLLTRWRRRKVDWPAMEFLLQSYRLNKTQMRLRELLLMALRTLVVFLAGAFAAGPISQTALESWFRKPAALRVVVLDDSYSMGRTGTTNSAWAIAKEALERVVRNAAERSQEGKVVVVRYSDSLTGQAAREATLSPEGQERLLEWAVRQRVSDSAAAPTEALSTAAALVEEARARGESAYVALLSDFCRRDHGDDAGFAEAIESLSSDADGLVLGDCTPVGAEQMANLTLTQMQLAPGPATAEIESTIELVIENLGEKPAAESLLRMWVDQREQPAVEIEEVSEGETVRKRVNVFLDRPGEHAVRAELSDDALAADNHRWIALTTPERRGVSLVDNSGDGLEGRAFALALRPKTQSKTGWAPTLRRTREIAALGDLSETAAVVLLDAPSLSRHAREELRRYVEQGGGLFVVAGPAVAPQRFNDHYVGQAEEVGSLLPPRGLGVPTQSLPPERGAPAIEAADHPVTRVLREEGASFLPMVRVTMHHTLVGTTGLGERQGEVLLKTHDGSALLVASTLGRGRVLSLLTSAATRGDGGQPWSNLAALPVFPLLVNDALAWLTEPNIEPRSLLVGDELPEPFTGLNAITESVEPSTVATGPRRALMRPGAYQTTGEKGRTALAVNVDPEEARLDAPGLSEMRGRFGRLAEVVAADELGRITTETPGEWLSHLTVLGLLLALIAERGLAYGSSYISSAIPAGGQV